MGGLNSAGGVSFANSQGPPGHTSRKAGVSAGVTVLVDSDTGILLL